MVRNTILTKTPMKQLLPINWLFQNKLWNYVFATVKRDVNLYDVAAKRMTQFVLKCVSVMTAKIVPMKN